MTDGTAAYADDVRHTGELVAGVLRSPHPHARIVSLDTAAARALPGVHAVLTAADVPERTYLDYRAVDQDRRMLADQVVRYVGEPVALVAAENEEAARRAVAAIRVRYDVRRSLGTVAAALRPGAPVLHPERGPDNVAATVRRRLGTDPQNDGDAHRVRRRFVSSRQTHATMEPHTVVAHWHEGRLEVWAPSQNPRLIQRDLAQLFEVPVRLHEVAVGGDFGGRTQISSTEALVCALTLATGRPVRLRQSRAEEFAFTKYRVPWEIDLDLGCDDDGRVTTLAADFDVDNGAYNQAAPGEMVYGATALGSSYRWRGYRADGRCVYTTKTPSSSFRGAGGYAVTWALECGIDELAEQAGWDPIDFRIRNAVGDPGEVSPTGWQVRSSALTACLETVRREIGWDEKRRQGGRGRGVGVACTIHVTALARDYMLRSSGALDIDADGHVRLRFGCGDAGTGQKTILCQAVAEVLGIDPDRVSIESTDTDHTPHDAGAGASRGSFVSGSTARRLAERARISLTAVAAAKLHVDPDAVRWRDGEAVAGPDALTLGDLAVLAGDGAPFTVETEWTGESHDPDPDGYEDIAPTYSFAAHAVEVEVDEDTGQVRVLRVVAAHDSGTVLNPISARGQVEGGVVQGLGAVLSESLVFEDGRVVNPSYVDYEVPRAAEAPEIDVHFLGEEDPAGPFGAKGLGEIPLLTIGPAVTNAIAHATGVRLDTAPHTPEQVLTAIRARDGKPLRTGSARTPRRWWIALVRWLYPRGLHHLLRTWGPRLVPAREPGRLESLRTPATEAEALAALREPDATPLGGGTDLLAREAQRLPVPAVAVDLRGVGDLTRIEAAGDLHLGGAVTLAEVERHPDVDAVLRATVASIATAQIRTAATVAGNLCQAKRCWFFRNGFDCYKRGGVTRPCYAVTGDHRFGHAVEHGHRCQAVTPSDLATTLVALDATAEVRSARGGRVLDVAGLYDGPGETVLAADELVARITVPARARGRRTVYRKLAPWQGAFAVATVAVSASVPTGGSAEDLRVVLGGVAPTPRRAGVVEDVLAGRRVDAALVDRACAAWERSTHPLADNHWKAFATSGLLRRTLDEVFEVRR
ncbi:MAG: molybdopterin-dependent oxidoreductase [Nocardioidaceae bacterium]|nr:molybdopterin-dependent oxidoreductase [Nocardioidaceae bacterium]